MTMLDRPPRLCLRLAYASCTPGIHRPKGAALAWEIWCLQRVLISLEAGMRNAATLRHRQDVIDHITELLEYVQGEPCLNERLAVKHGRKRGEQR